MITTRTRSGSMSVKKIEREAGPVQTVGRLGASVRLALAGTPHGCLLCAGGLRAGEAGRVLRSPQAERQFREHRDWQAERLGSLASLNQVAVGLGTRMIEDLAAERLDRSTWLQVEFDAAGQVHVVYPRMTAPADTCPLCSRLTARADAGLAEVARLVRELAQSTPATAAPSEPTDL